ncbi:outer membrane protein [Helicobacter cetorum]|uniref:outer membrane protein n=1 Tax=Helicobacter cetorum TaxID=138563 RepID=UPI001E45D0AB|nr:outer membrane protein [Helicobacter cetorum]
MTIIKQVVRLLLKLQHLKFLPPPPPSGTPTAPSSSIGSLQTQLTDATNKLFSQMSGDSVATNGGYTTSANGSIIPNANSLDAKYDNAMNALYGTSGMTYEDAQSATSGTIAVSGGTNGMKAASGSVYGNYQDAQNAINETAKALFGAVTTTSGTTSIAAAEGSATEGFSVGSGSLASKFDSAMNDLYSKMTSAEGGSSTVTTAYTTSDGQIQAAEGSVAQLYNTAKTNLEGAQTLSNQTLTLLYGDSNNTPITSSTSASATSLYTLMKDVNKTSSSTNITSGLLTAVLDDAQTLQTTLNKATSGGSDTNSATEVQAVSSGSSGASSSSQSVITTLKTTVGNVVTTLQNALSQLAKPSGQDLAQATLKGLSADLKTLEQQTASVAQAKQNNTETINTLLDQAQQALYGTTGNPGTAQSPQTGSVYENYQKAYDALYGTSTSSEGGQSTTTKGTEQNPASGSLADQFDKAWTKYEDAVDKMYQTTSTTDGQSTIKQPTVTFTPNPSGNNKQGKVTPVTDDSNSLNHQYSSLNNAIYGASSETSGTGTLESPAENSLQKQYSSAVEQVQTAGKNLVDAIDAQAKGLNTTQAGMTASNMSSMSAQTNALSNAIITLSSIGTFSNLDNLSNTLKNLEDSQKNLSNHLNSSSASVGALTQGTNSTLATINKAIGEVDAQLLALSGSSESSNPNATTEKTLLSSLKTTLTNQKNALLSVQKNVNMAIASAKKTTVATVTNTNNHGQMYGVNVMAGYKHFFGKKKRWGFRTYAYYSFNHANLSFVGTQAGYMNGASQVNNHTYGVGFDALYNFYESKEGYNTAGIFFGFGLGGETWLVQGESHFKNMMNACNAMTGCSASMNTSYFQMPVQVGFRTNFAKHSGIELGFKVPLFVNQFYKERGEYGDVDVFYKRNFSMYLNYMINF